MMTFVYYSTSYFFDAFSFPESKFLGSYGGDIFDFGIGVVIPARQATYRLSGRYDSPMPESAISHSQGLWIWLQLFRLQFRCKFLEGMTKEISCVFSLSYPRPFPKLNRPREWLRQTLRINGIRSQKFKNYTRFGEHFYASEYSRARVGIGTNVQHIFNAFEILVGAATPPPPPLDFFPNPSWLPRNSNFLWVYRVHFIHLARDYLTL